MENGRPEKRIEIQENGPYRVYGDIPIAEMAPVHTFNGEPVDWHTLRDLTRRRGPVELCRCGQSSRLPFCDASHERNGFDGSEAATRRPFLERADIRRKGDQAIARDSSLCLSAGFCGTRTTNVHRMLQEETDPARIQLMRDMVWRCPAGSIAMVGQDERLDEPELEPEIAILPGGPIWVKGGIPIYGSDGQQWEVLNRVTVCRCGASEIKPFCDGTHMDKNFDER